MTTLAFRAATRSFGRATFAITLAALCAALCACHTRTLGTARTEAAPAVILADTAAPAGSDAQPTAMAPAAPFDDKPITPMESVGASGKD